MSHTLIRHPELWWVFALIAVAIVAIGWINGSSSALSDAAETIKKEEEYYPYMWNMRSRFTLRGILFIMFVAALVAVGIHFHWLH